MKPKTFTKGRLLFALMILGVTLALVSWDYKQLPTRYHQSTNDTVPETKKEKKILDLDDVLDKLNAAEMQVNMEKVQKELAEAMKKIDVEKMKFDMEKAMKEVDFEKIKKEVEQSMAKIDMKKMQEEMAEAMKEIDAAKIQQEVRASIQKIDWDKMKTELDDLKKVDMSKVETEMKKIQEEMKELGPKLQKEMEKTKQEMEKAKVEMKEYKEFVDGLEKDGLINKKEGYIIKHKEGELIVNGKKVSEQVYSKYRNFLEKHKKFNIEKSDDDFNIDID